MKYFKFLICFLILNSFLLVVSHHHKDDVNDENENENDNNPSTNP
jgi:hypothetical protein